MNSKPTSISYKVIPLGKLTVKTDTELAFFWGGGLSKFPNVVT